MAMPLLNIWTNIKLGGPALEMLKCGTAPHELILSQQLSDSTFGVAEADPNLTRADVAFGQPDVAGTLHSERLRWLHLSSAGYTRFDTPEFRKAAEARELVVTNSSQVYAEPCAEHVFAFMLANARRLPQALDVQRTDRSWPGLRLRAESRLLLHQTVLLLGFGAIARRLTEFLRPFSVRILALRRKPAGGEAVEIVSKATLAHALAEADHVVDILPDSPATQHFITAHRLASMKRGAVFYNIGRGATVNQTALLDALNSGHLAAAYLDVTEPEPLPPSHPLWSAPNCFITPHTAGGHAGELEALTKHFLENFRRFLEGAPLLDRIM